MPVSSPTSLTRRAFIGALSLAALGASLFGAQPHARASQTQGDSAAPDDIPDYTDLANWAYWADGMTADSGEVACGAAAAPGLDGAASAQDKPVDLFIVCPTVAMGEDGAATMDLANVDDRASFVGALNMELGIYSDTCRVFAPFYRQATLAMYETGGAELPNAIDFAYRDVAAAFERYLEENPDRPLVLAGFSQGSEHIVKLIADYLDDARPDGAKLQQRLVAAYAIGWRLTEDDCEGRPWLRPAQAADDLGVVVTFNSEDPAVEESLVVPAGCTTYAINPLSWSTSSEEAPAELNLGACFTDYSGEIVEEVPAFCGAYIDPDRGTLKVIGVDPADYPPGLSIFDKGVYHLYDYQFFYRNLQENVGVRVERYLSQS